MAISTWIGFNHHELGIPSSNLSWSFKLPWIATENWSYDIFNIAIENSPVEIVDLPIEHGGSFHSKLSKLLTFTRGECQARNINQINQAFSSWQLGVQCTIPNGQVGDGAFRRFEKTWLILDSLGKHGFFLEVLYTIYMYIYIVRYSLDQS